MKGNKTLLLGFLMCLSTLAAVWWIVERQQKKIGVIDAVKLFDSFNMKKELEAKSKIKLEMIGKQVDSVKTLLEMARASKNEEEIKKMAYTYNYIQASLDNEFKKSNHDINEQVWKRLNPMVDEFGKAHKLHLIIGANGMGSVLYEDGYFDLTPDVITFVNKKYEEGN